MTFLIGLIDPCRERGIEVDSSGLPEGVRGLLALVYVVPERAGACRQKARHPGLCRLGRRPYGLGRREYPGRSTWNSVVPNPIRSISPLATACFPFSMHGVILENKTSLSSK
ncbi:MAG: hypothetical protein ACRED0_03270 [Gammaproteobacteria bacterium]